MNYRCPRHHAENMKAEYNTQLWSPVFTVLSPYRRSHPWKSVWRLHGICSPTLTRAGNRKRGCIEAFLHTTEVITWHGPRGVFEVAELGFVYITNQNHHSAQHLHHLLRLFKQNRRRFSVGHHLLVPLPFCRLLRRQWYRGLQDALSPCLAATDSTMLKH